MLILRCAHHGIHIFHTHTECALPATMAASAPTGTGAGAGTGTPPGTTGTDSMLGGLWSRLGALLTPPAPRPAHPASDTAAVAAADTGSSVPSLLVCLLAGNPVTSAAIITCLNTADATRLRRLHPAVAGVVAAVPWRDMDTPVVDAVRWRKSLLAAAGARLAGRAIKSLLTSEPAVAALGGVTHLHLRKCTFVTDALLLRLPTSLCTLNVDYCSNLTGDASFAHLTALVTLDCSGTWVVSERADGLPPSLLELDIRKVPVHGLQPVASLAHLSQLRVLRADGSRLGDATLASLPPTLETLSATGSTGMELTPAASFGHLTALRLLDVADSGIGDGSLATMPPCLVNLNVQRCYNLTRAAVLPHLPALRVLDASDTFIGDALVASLPASLIRLRLAGCHRVTADASLTHLHALQQLHSIGTDLAPTALAACRTRGCTVPSARQLDGHSQVVYALALLADGRLAGGDESGAVGLWDVAAEGKATAVVLMAFDTVHALVALRDGHRLAIGTVSWRYEDCGVEVWDVSSLPPARRATINCKGRVWALAVLADGRLAAGCDDGKVRVMDVDARAVRATLTGHRATVQALAVLPGGALASGSWDTTVRVWDVAARVCVATLTGHTGKVRSLAVLADGRLASGADEDGAVRLWDVGARTCVGVLPGHTDGVAAMAALPDGRLATASADGTVKLWDTRPAATAGASHAVGAVPAEVVGVPCGWVGALLALPDGRLACACSTAAGNPVYLFDLPPPPAAYEHW